jgi:NAD(P)-dependent dehydrogenase (short-subunit alcohol dehydrogenase family)
MGKTVIITGASGNLGSAVTSHFLNQDYRVIATVTNEEAKKSFTPHQNLQVEIVDLANEASAASFVKDAIKKHEVIDAALLLVGGFAMGNIGATDTKAIREQLTLNFETAYHVARPLYEHMAGNRSGRIVFIGSRPALQASAGKNLIAYGLSKSLLFKLAEYINEEGKGKNVTATVVVPSTIDTPQNRKSMPEADPGKWVNPEALAEILEFVVSGKGSPLRETVLKVYNDA